MRKHKSAEKIPATRPPSVVSGSSHASHDRPCGPVEGNVGTLRRTGCNFDTRVVVAVVEHQHDAMEPNVRAPSYVL